MFFKRVSLIAALFISLFFQGCATFMPAALTWVSKRPPADTRFFNLLDLEVKKAGLQDGVSSPVTGFPYLRTNRFLVTLGDRLNDEDQRDRWVRQMMQLNLDARKKEIQNLSSAAVARLTGRLGLASKRSALIARMNTAASAIFQFDKTQIDYYKTIQLAGRYPDEYSTALRFIGLYPLASLPVAFLTDKVRREFRAWYATPLDRLPVLGKLTPYSPSQKTFSLMTDVSRMFPLSTDELGIPQMTEKEKKDILLFFAPILFQDVAAPYDQPGEVIWDGNRVNVDPEKPSVYYYFTFSLFKKEPVLQINYVTWYIARKGGETPWIERGHIDGMTIRFTLTPDGRPFMLDIMNNCGCYHFFVPQKKMVAQQIAKPFRPDAFVPQWLPDAFQPNRLGIRINSGWHQVQRIMSQSIPSNPVIYKLIPYHVLERLPHPDGRTESIFKSLGIVKGSGRLEPLLLFPMGIPDVGSMRQRGHHPIELMGRAHFDDPNLFERTFSFK